MAQFQSYIRGTGSYLPSGVLTNADIEKLVDTNNAWIVERTGIRERRIAPKEQATSDLAFEAAKKALEAAKLQPTDIDLIIFATLTPDQLMPNTACLLQAKLGARDCAAWDLNAACSGFLFATSVANQYISSGTYKNILVIGAEILSRIVNYKDRGTCILFGDGAGAMVLSRVENNSPSQILSESLFSDGSLSDLLVLAAGGSKMPYTHEVLEKGLHFMTMKGPEIFKNAIRTMSRGATQVLEAAGVAMNEVAWIIPHQANQRIIEGVAKQLDFPMEKVIINLEKTGNTSAASVPMAFDEAIRSGKVKRGDLVLIAVFGAGLTSGALLLRY